MLAAGATHHHPRTHLAQKKISVGLLESIFALPFMIMFAGYKDEVAKPTAADDGVFIPQAELSKWWKKLQSKYPYDLFMREELCAASC